MSKLIQRYRANPTEANAKALRLYMGRHMMAECFATPEEQAILRQVGA